MCYPQSVVGGAAEPTTLKHLQVTIKTSGTKRKRGVRFLADHDENSRDLKKQQIVDFIPSVLELTEDEKSIRWYRGEERAEIQRRLSRDAQESRLSDNKMILLGQPHFCFRDTYANVFAACHLIASREEDDMCAIISPEIFTFMATNDARGLEDRTAPRVAVERRLLRAQQIKLVLQEQASNDPERVRAVAQELSRPARKLAESLGIIDATAAMMMYCDSSSMETLPPTQPETREISRPKLCDTSCHNPVFKGKVAVAC